jgi:hypothetical protein
MIYFLKIAGVEVKLFRCDHYGKSKEFQNELKSTGLNIKFEFFGPRTPELNNKDETKFQTFNGRIRALLNCAGLKDD